jgi:DNA-binding MarR family transcriptional regulator
MVRSLRAELKQGAPFQSLEEEALLSILRTADLINRSLAAMFKEHGLTLTQYNVLRILRGAGAEGLPSGEVADRMITREPDITRLLDRMEERGWVHRRRDPTDRRVVRAYLTLAGRELVDRLDAPVVAMHTHCLGHLDEVKLAELSDLLGTVREGGRGSS